MPTIDGQGCASLGAGVGPAGFDLDSTPSDRVLATPIPAPAFDPYNRVYPYETNFTMQEMTPTMHRAAHLALPRGSLPATPNEGVDFTEVANASPDQRQRAAEDAMRNAFRPLLIEGVLRIDSVTPEDVGGEWTGRIFTDVTDLSTGRDLTLQSKAR